jgi:hypothetical protein
VQLWFVTPAFRRFALAEVCFDQWKLIAAALAGHGIELRVVVVSDDDNLDLARAAGFDTVEQNNDWLGRRFNDWVTGVGNDSWIDPAYFVPLPEAPIARRMRLLSVVTSTRLAELRAARSIGITPYLFHRSLLEPAGYRPLEDKISRGCDTSTIVGIEYARDYERIVWEERDLHQYQHVSFRAYPHLTRYSRLWAAYGERELYDPWGILAEHYPIGLVERARAALGSDTQRGGARSPRDGQHGVLPAEAVA